MQTPAIRIISLFLVALNVALPRECAYSDTPNFGRATQSPGEEPRLAANTPRQPSVKPSPVATVLRWGDTMLSRADEIEGYSCTFTKRERISGRLGERQVFQAKIRHRPFSVYLKCQSPRSMAQTEAVWVEGRNNGNLLARGNGIKSILGTMALDPNGYMAMQDNLHPITDIGVRNLVQKMITTTQHDARLGEVGVVFRRNAKVGDRVCTCVEFDHPVPKRGLRYRLSRLYIDDELSLPIRFEGYTWPRQRGGDPVLFEEYTYTNVKLKNELTDHDFQL